MQVRTLTCMDAASRCGGSSSLADVAGPPKSRSARPPAAGAGAAPPAPSRYTGAADAAGLKALALAVMANWRPCPEPGPWLS